MKSIFQQINQIYLIINQKEMRQHQTKYSILCKSGLIIHLCHHNLILLLTLNLKIIRFEKSKTRIRDSQIARTTFRSVDPRSRSYRRSVFRPNYFGLIEIESFKSASINEKIIGFEIYSHRSPS